MLVVIPVCNRGQLALKTLNSVYAQTVRPTLVVVVDDGSTDDSCALIDDWLAQHSDLNAILLKQENKGAGAARNLAIRSRWGEADAVIFLDSDDIWPPDFLARTSAQMLATPETVAVSTDRVLYDVERQQGKHESLAELAANPWAYFLKRGAGIGSCTLIRMDAAKGVGGYPEDIPTGQDVVFFGRVAGLGEWGYCKGVGVTFSTNYSNVYPQQSGHIHKGYTDFRARWAKAFEQMVAESPSRIRYSLQIRKLLSKRWFAAALQVNQSDSKESLNCLRKAIHCYPYKLKYYFYFLRIAIRNR